MARPTKSDMSRRDTESALYKVLELNSMEEKFYKDQVTEYMKFYDNLAKLNEVLDDRIDVDVLREKRQVTKEMRSILMFLGLKPLENGGGGFEDL